MADTLISQADRAFVEEDFEDAVDLYTQALNLSPQACIYESRANAHIKLEQYLDAAEDASKAIELDPSLAKAYLRKGVACFNLEEYESAKEVFEAGQKVAPENNQFMTWIRKCQAEIDEELEASSPKRATTSTTPPIGYGNLPAAAPVVASTKPQPTGAPSSSTAPAATVTAATAEPLGNLTPAALASLAFEGKYRHQWYQLQSKVSVDVYAKNLKAEQISCVFESNRLTVTTRDASGEEDYKLDVELYGKILPDKSKYEVLKTKVEITLVKADTVQWGSLEKSNVLAAPNYSDPAQAPVQYPSSYTKAPKDWEKVDSELAEMEKKGDLDDGDPLNNFFKKIFGQGDEDQRRAMMKSFQESNGTVLSTNWKDVGSKKTECTPPSGMDVKKWES
eukprot:gene1463-32840_t